MMMIPEAFERHESMSQERRDFYDYHASLMEPWDGPAMVAATDGKQLGVVLDRNGLRPLRYSVTKDGVVVMGSETGVLDIPPERIAQRGRVQPGRIFLIDMDEGRIVADDEVKQALAAARPYGHWLADQRLGLDDLPEPELVPGPNFATLRDRQQSHGFTTEELVMLVAPMAAAAKEPVGSMGDDTPLAVLSAQGQPLFNYFRQLFAQVTNPPLDAQWEALVTSTETLLGPRGQHLRHHPGSGGGSMKLSRPVITNRQLAQIKELDEERLRARTLSTLFHPSDGEGDGEGALERALTALQHAAADAVDAGHSILVLSDRGIDATHAPIPSLLAVAAVHHHLIAVGRRTQASWCWRRASRARRASLRGAGRLRRRRDQPLPGARVAARVARAGRARPQRQRRGDGGALPEGDRQGRHQGDVEDGHLHGLRLPRRADLRGRGAGPGSDRHLLHRHGVPHRRHRPARDRGRRAPPPRPRLPRPRDRRAARTARRRRLPLAPRRRAPHVQPADDRAAAGGVHHATATTSTSSSPR